MNSGNALTANTINDLPAGPGNDALNNSTNGSVIVPFESSAGGNVLDLRDILRSLNGYAGTNASAGRYWPFDRADDNPLVATDNSGPISPMALVTFMNELLTQTDAGNHAF